MGTSARPHSGSVLPKAGPYKEVPYEGAENEIKQLIGDITLEMSAEDYNLPDLVVNDINIEMPENLSRALYDRMEKEFFIQLGQWQAG